ncbi:hypothetical protein [Streptomyces yaizuensis]|uniref:PepSY domain-containing protein n=1 Tax=Streptomyces yaizuensis TaxID=2989713 RepID=A0ABQ5NX02_9ACTN|nr:hypothetical protein [Streptomyces sp. YSPA8]GLF94903.1 PepSY domain-containing protein [Streptomyces sp. YSPA8]
MSVGGGQGGSSLSDEEWERFLRESVDGVRGAPEEPSARAREVTRRLRENPARPEPWRTYSPARPKSRKGWYVAGLLASVALLVVALLPGRVTGLFGDGGGGGGGGAGQPLAGESERPTQPPPTESALRPTPKDPFRGSPAARWASGTAGISLPAARATGWMTTAQVRQALARTRDFHAASNLDPGVLRGERPRRAIALINPRQQDTREFLAAAFRAPDEENDPLMLFSRFDTERVRLIGDDVRTRGRITYREGPLGALRVTADVTYVYAVAPARGGDEVARTIVRRETVLNWDNPAKVHTEPGTFSLVSYTVDVANGGCGAAAEAATGTGRGAGTGTGDGAGLLAPEFGSGQSAGAGTGPAVDPYDRSTSMPERMRTGAGGDGCGTATRT